MPNPVDPDVSPEPNGEATSKQRSRVAWGLLWCGRALALLLLLMVYTEERRLGELQHGPLNAGETWHDRKYDFYHGIEDRFYAALLLAAMVIVFGIISARSAWAGGCAFDVVTFLLACGSAFDAVASRFLHGDTSRALRGFSVCDESKASELVGRVKRAVGRQSEAPQGEGFALAANTPCSSKPWVE